MKEVKGPKMAGFPARMAQCGTIVKAPMMGDVMKEGTASYMSKNQADYEHDAKKVRAHMCKDAMQFWGLNRAKPFF